MTVQAITKQSNNKLMAFYKSSLGKKVVMAVTGVMLIGFVVMHLLGNMQIFLGAEKFNGYAAFLKSIPGPLWAARIVLLSAFILHVVTAFNLKKKNTQARKVGYRNQADIQLDPSSKYMLETGLVVLLFIAMHLAHFTMGLLQPEYYSFHDNQGHHDVYKMVIEGFRNGPYFLLYIVSMLALSFHLRHAFWSMFQSFGAYNPELGVCLKRSAKVLSAVIGVAYCSIPLAVKFGILN